MRTKTPLRLAAAMLLAASTLSAANVAWDTTPGTVGAGDSAITGGPGTWNTTNGNWTTDAGVNNIAWVNANNDTAVFGGAGGTVTLGAGITANGLTFNTGGYALSGATLTLAGATPTIAVTGSGDTATIADQLMGAAGLVKTGAGTLVLSGDNRFTGDIAINAGVLELAPGGKLYNAGYNNAAVITVNTGGTWRVNDFSYDGVGKLADYATRRVINGGTIEVLGATHSSGQDFTVTTAGGTFRYAPASNTSVLTLNGNANDNIRLNGTLAFDTDAGIVVTEVMQGAGGVVKTGTGTLTLGAANTYTGGTTASGGTLVLANAAALQNSVLTSAGAAVVFDQSVTGNAFTVGGLTGSGALALVNNASTPAAIALTVGNGNTSSSYSGVLSGAGSLIKTGAGTLTLAGNNPFTGGITVNAGRLSLSGNNASAVTVNSGAVFGASATGSTTGSLTTNAGAGLAIAGGTPGSGFTANGVNVAGATTLSFDTTQVSGNTYTVVNYGAGGLTGLANLTAAARGTFTDTGSAVTFTAGATYTDTWNTTTGIWNSGTTANWSNGADSLFYGGDAVVFNNPASASIVTIAGLVTPGSITVNNTAGYTFSGTGSIGGSGSLTKQGSGTLIISTANSYSGGTTVSGGELQALTDTSAGAKTVLGTGAVTVNSGATLRLKTTSTGNDLSYANAINLNNATLASEDGVVTYTGALSMTGNNTFNVVYAGKNAIFTNTASSTGAITKSGLGSLIFNGGLTSTGITVSAGTLQLGGATNNTAGITLAGGGALIVKSGATLTSTGTLGTSNSTGATIIVESGATFNAASVSIPWNSGTFKVDGALNITGDMRVSTNATTNLTGAGTISAVNFTTGNASATVFNSSVATVNLSGSVIVGDSGAGGNANAFTQSGGTITAAGVRLGYSDTTAAQTFSLTSGTLRLGAAGISSLGAGTRTVNFGAATVGSTAAWSSSLAMALTSSAGTTFDTTGGAITLSGVLSGATGKLIKTGTGILTLSGANTYAGGTAISAGTLAVSGTIRINGASGITIASGAALTLSGTLVATTGSDTIVNNGGTFTAGGVLDLNGTFDGFNSGGSGIYSLITGTGGTNAGAFTDVTGFNNAVWSDVTYSGGVLPFTAVPEHASYGLLGAGVLAGMAFVKRRRKK